MERLLNKQDLENQLEGKRADIDARIDAIKNEIEGAGDDAKRYFIDQPLKVAGGLLAAGVVVGIVVSGNRRRKGRKQLKRSHRAIVERYVDALVDDVRFRLSGGDDPEQAVRSAFDGRTPLIVVDNEETNRGLFREIFDIALKTALGFAVSVFINQLATRVDLGQQIEQFVDSVVPEQAPANGQP